MGRCTMVNFTARPHIMSKQEAHYCSLFPLPSVDEGKHGLERPAKCLGSLSSLTYGE